MGVSYTSFAVSHCNFITIKFIVFEETKSPVTKVYLKSIEEITRGKSSELKFIYKEKLFKKSRKLINDLKI